MVDILVFTCGCNTKPGKTSNDDRIIAQIDSNNWIDYKASTYKFFIGQNKDSIARITELHLDHMANDYKLSDTGVVVHYMNIGEDLLIANNRTILPALFFKTHRNELVEFRCSTLFTPASFDSTGIDGFFKTAEPVFSILKQQTARNTLIKTFRLQINKPGYEEVFYIDTAGRKYDMLFCYDKKRK